MICAMRRN